TRRPLSASPLAKRNQRNEPQCYPCRDQPACREMAVPFQHHRVWSSAVEARHPRRRARRPRWCHLGGEGFGGIALVRILPSISAGAFARSLARRSQWQAPVARFSRRRRTKSRATRCERGGEGGGWLRVIQI